MYALTSLQRLSTLAGTTFIQLVRMKIFLFLLFFVVIFLASNTLRFSQVLGPETAGEQELTLMKESTLGIMRLFCLIFSVTATALLIPRDSEDRILYTILCKPVPRWEYLAGKLLGVMALIFTVLACMDVLFSVVLEWRTSLIAGEQLQALNALPEIDEGTKNAIIQRIESQGPSWSLQLGIGTLFLEGLLLCSITLFLSVFSTSSIFSIIIAFCVYLIGLFQEEIRSMWFSSIGQTIWDNIGKFCLSIVFPDFRMFALMDNAINGKDIPGGMFLTIAFVTLGYMVMYLSAASLIYKKKEF